MISLRRFHTLVRRLAQTGGPAQFQVVAAGELGHNVRDRPDLAAKRVGVLEKGQIVRAQERASTEDGCHWIQLLSEDNNGILGWTLAERQGKIFLEEAGAGAGDEVRQVTSVLNDPTESEETVGAAVQQENVVLEQDLAAVKDESIVSAEDAKDVELESEVADMEAQEDHRDIKEILHERLVEATDAFGVVWVCSKAPEMDIRDIAYAFEYIGANLVGLKPHIRQRAMVHSGTRKLMQQLPVLFHEQSYNPLSNGKQHVSILTHLHDLNKDCMLQFNRLTDPRSIQQTRKKQFRLDSLGIAIEQAMSSLISKFEIVVDDIPLSDLLPILHAAAVMEVNNEALLRRAIWVLENRIEEIPIHRYEMLCWTLVRCQKEMNPQLLDQMAAQLSQSVNELSTDTLASICRTFGILEASEAGVLLLHALSERWATKPDVQLSPNAISDLLWAMATMEFPAKESTATQNFFDHLIPSMRDRIQEFDVVHLADILWGFMTLDIKTQDLLVNATYQQRQAAFIGPSKGMCNQRFLKGHTEAANAQSANFVFVSEKLAPPSHLGREVSQEHRRLEFLAKKRDDEDVSTSRLIEAIEAEKTLKYRESVELSEKHSHEFNEKVDAVIAVANQLRTIKSDDEEFTEKLNSFMAVLQNFIAAGANTNIPQEECEVMRSELIRIDEPEMAEVLSRLVIQKKADPSQLLNPPFPGLPGFENQKRRVKAARLGLGNLDHTTSARQKFNNMTAKALKELCRVNGLKMSGRKEEVIHRLLQAKVLEPPKVEDQ